MRKLSVRRLHVLLVIASSACGAAAACGSDDAPASGGNADASAIETGAREGGSEAAAADAGSEASAADASATDGGDAGTDAGSDASADAPSDAPPDAFDAGPITCADGGAPILANGAGFSQVSVFVEDAKLVMPSSIVGDGNRRFWIQDPAGNGASGDKLLDVSPAGVVTERLYPSGAALCASGQVARDSSGNAYMFDTVTDGLYRTTPAGSTTTFSNVGGVGGGGNCTDTGVIGLLARADDSFFAASPLNAKIYTLTANGVTRADFVDVTAPGRLAHDGAGGFYVVAGGTDVLAVSSAGVVTTRLTPTGVNPFAIRRDGNGDLYFTNGTRLYRSLANTTTFHEVAACFPGVLMDIVFDHPSNDAGAGTSLYVLTSGSDVSANDPGDKLFEMKR